MTIHTYNVYKLVWLHEESIVDSVKFNGNKDQISKSQYIQSFFPALLQQQY